MAFSEETYLKIQRYLDRKLSPEEQADFEREMRADQALAEEVTLQAEMEELLADSQENQLRKNLQILNAEVKDDKPGAGGTSFPKWLWLLIPIFLLGGWWLLNPPQKKVPPVGPSTETSTGSQEEETNQGAQKTEEKTDESETPLEQEAPETKERVEPQEPSPTNRVIAANFDPNPSLEFMIDNNLRSIDYEWTATTPQKNITLATATTPVKFQFSGTLKSSAKLLEQDFKLHLFSNNPAAFEAFKPIFSSDLSLQQSATGVYQIDFQKQVKLSPGLYYYLIEEAGEEKVYLVGKFKVRR